MVEREVVERVARIARLSLTAEEVKRFTKDLSSVLEAFDSIGEAKTDGVEPAFQPFDIKDVVREDAPAGCLSQQEALINAEQKEGGFIKGPKAV
ncbi:Asp-tRNA(Asn)/Glu-tRNA(Gln) amidotransferase subunit GatC [Candidatus Micrarchaeota archaeon]|nr:Asp-tRNA(Asn)/Glu-tRNA(Gln) amidotransferase subunit GatC [Candidatus Micrarchaeota archaeon]